MACLGGPIEALEGLCGSHGAKSTIGYMSCLVQNLKNYKPRVDFFPTSRHGKQSLDINIPGVDKFPDFDDESDEEDQESGVDDDHSKDQEEILTQVLMRSVKVVAMIMCHISSKVN